jgi:hypothetical protein
VRRPGGFAADPGNAAEALFNEERGGSASSSRSRPVLKPATAQCCKDRLWSMQNFVGLEELVGEDSPLLTCDNSALCRFYRLLVKRSHSNLAPRGASCTHLFPSDLPFGSAERLVTPPLGSRRRHRFLLTLRAQRWTNALWALFSFWELGCPDDASLAIAGWRKHTHRLHQQYASRLVSQVRAFCRSDGPLRECPLDGARKRVSEVLKAVPVSKYCVPVRGLGIVDTNIACDIEPDNVAMPESAGAMDPSPFLTTEQLEVRNNMRQILKDREEWENAPLPCHKVPPDLELRMAARLLDTSMAVLVESALLPRTVGGRILVGGLFGVPKSSGKIRLIFDRRPQNFTEERVNWSLLPSAAQLGRIVLPKGKVLRGSGSDLSNYYYNIAHHPEWVVHNAVGRPLTGEFVIKYGGDPNRVYYTCFRVLGMGDLNAVCFGQVIHENLLKQAQALSEEHCMRYGKNTPPYDLLQGVYIDDFLVTLQVERSLAHVPGEDSILMARAEQAYIDAGLPRSVEKDFRSELNFKAWGAEVRGGVGTSGGPRQVRRECWALTRHVIKFGWVCKKIMQQLLGIFASLLVYRREFFLRLS